MLDETKRFAVSNILNQWFHFKGGQRTKAFTTRFIFFTVPSYYCPAPGRIFHFLKACLSLSLIVQSKLKLSGTTAQKPANITTYQYHFLHLPPPPSSQLSETIPPVKWHQWIVINSNGKSYIAKSQIQWWREQFSYFISYFLFKFCTIFPLAYLNLYFNQFLVIFCHDEPNK